MEESTRPDEAVARIAAAIGERARVRMLYCLMDNRARTSTELALVAEVSPSTASTHLGRLRQEGLVRVHVQGKHRYYSLGGSEVAAALEKLSFLSGGSTMSFEPGTPSHLRAGRTCYDHLAGALGVALHDRVFALGWLQPALEEGDDAYDLTAPGIAALEALGVDVGAARARRRRFAYACLDWSERRSHIGGSLGAALLQLALDRRWVSRERTGRALRVTPFGRSEFRSRFGLDTSARG